MKIIISPAKKMKENWDDISYRNLPMFLEDSKRLMKHMKMWNQEKAKSIWKCNDKLTQINMERLAHMNLESGLTPAVLSYEGLQYQYMAPIVMSQEQMDYLEAHLRILSGFYGLLRPFDGVTPYRLEMQARLGEEDIDSLYEFWGARLAQELWKDSKCVLNLASKEYSKCISKWIPQDKKFITCVFGEYIDGKVKEKGTLAKMARGEMVRFLTEHQVEAIEKVKEFQGSGYKFAEEESNENTYIFIKQ